MTTHPLQMPEDWVELPGLNGGYLPFMRNGSLIGINLYHFTPNNTWCGGLFIFDVPEASDEGEPKWKLRNKQYLTLAPSIVCECGLHGFISGGVWYSLEQLLEIAHDIKTPYYNYFTSAEKESNGEYLQVRT